MGKMGRTTLEQWRMFKAVVDHGGFAQAALVVHKSQSSIHHAVHKLEQLLGVRLLQVEGRRAELTEAGAVMLRRAAYLLEEVEKMESVAESVSAGIETHLKLAVDQVFPQQALYTVLDSVSRQYPQLRVELNETVLSGANELLREGQVDISLSPYTVQGHLNEEICKVEFIAVAGPQHPLLDLPAPIGIEPLRACRQIVLRDSAKQGRQDAGWLGSEQRWTLDHLRTSIEFVMTGLGFAWLPYPAIRDHLESGRLVRLSLSEGGKRTVPLYLNFADVDRLGPVSRSFIGELRYQTLGLPTAD